MGSSFRLITCHFILLGFITFSPAFLLAQTYASPELERNAQQEMNTKNKQLGIVDEPTVADENSNRSYHNIELTKLKGTFQLKTLKAIDYSGTHNKTEMKLFTAHAQKELASKHIAIDLEQNKIYFLSKLDKQDQMEYQISIVDGWMIVDNYRECSNYKFKIVSISPHDITLNMVPQDENQHFVFELTLTKK